MKLVKLLLLLLILNSCYNPSPTDIIDDLEILVGDWESYKGVKFNENWRIVSDSLFKGEGFSLNGTDTAFYESLEIFKVGDSIYYRVLFENKKVITDFALSEASKTSWTFINPHNDYPSIIKYEVKKDSLLLVTISNIRGNKEQFFYLKRIKVVKRNSILEIN